ncbi:MAG: DEAD/DEAH box helicase [Planctomycetaceae bacterium]|jgi:ATP-dependent RNA helicase DeaD|nr:DEAD/DEAH box helicase [Planctomycetaceae bacterium]
MKTTKNTKNNPSSNANKIRNNKSSRHTRVKKQDRHADLVESFQWGFVEGADSDGGGEHSEFRTQNKPRKKSKMKTAAKNIDGAANTPTAAIAQRSPSNLAAKNKTEKISANHPKKKKKKIRRLPNSTSINVTNITENTDGNRAKSNFEKNIAPQNAPTKIANTRGNVKNTRQKINVAQNNIEQTIHKNKEPADANLLFESFEDDNDLNLPSYGRTFKNKNLSDEQETKLAPPKNIVTENHKQPNTHVKSLTPASARSPQILPQPAPQKITSITPQVKISTSQQSGLSQPPSYSAPVKTQDYDDQKYTRDADFHNVKSSHAYSSQDKLNQNNPNRYENRTPPQDFQRPKKEQMVWDPDKREYVPLKISEPVLPATPPETTNQPPAKSQRQTITTKQTSNKIASKSDLKKNNHTTIDKKTAAANLSTSRRRQVTDDVEVAVIEPDGAERLQTKVPQRGDVPLLVSSKRPDPADIESDARGFARLGLSDVMLEALRILRYNEPTPIQEGVFERIKTGKDIMGQAQTGTGKTAAFSIPIIEGIEECPPGNEPVALILVPTRELAVQVRDEIVRLSYGRDIRIAACYGGKPIVKQIAKLSEGIDIVVGTPGRVLDLMNRRVLITNLLKWVVLDEADRMLDIGFRPDIEKILKKSPSTRQTLLFSATLPPPVVKLAERYMREPESLDFSNKNVSVETIEQFYVTIDHERKFDALVYLLNEERPNQAIIFTRTKRGADRLARLLSKQIANLAAIHGDLTQVERDKIMSKFRAGELRYLVATDVVGRGIDVSGISHIINYDIPHFCDDYVHRVGRTGRMGREGVAYTFVTAEEGNELTRIEMRIEKLLKRADLKGFESFSKPVQTNDINDDKSQNNHKPVFGKPVRKIRRAL